MEVQKQPGNLSLMRIWFKDGNKRTFKSFERVDAKFGRQGGINQLKKFVLTGKTKQGEPVLPKVEGAIIYCQISGDEIERVVINGKRVS